MDKKLIYIYDNIYKINDHKNLISIIKTHNCKYTENNNGIFINLNTLEENIINNIFFLVHNEINSDIDENYYEIIEPDKPIKKEPVKIYIKKKDSLYLEDFTDYEKEIIIKSKFYKL